MPRYWSGPNSTHDLKVYLVWDEVPENEVRLPDYFGVCGNRLTADRGKVA